jgi:hypothetical protein
MTAALSPEDAVAIRQLVDGVRVSPEVRVYIADITRSTREERMLSLGASPRATVALFRAARAAAVLDGRDFATPDDVKGVTLAVLRHRISSPPSSRWKGAAPTTCSPRCWRASAFPSDVVSFVPEPLRRFGRRVKAIAVVPTRRLAVLAAVLAPLCSCRRCRRRVDRRRCGAAARRRRAARRRHAAASAIWRSSAARADDRRRRRRGAALPDRRAGGGRSSSSLHDELPPARLAGGIEPRSRPAPRGSVELAGTVRGMARGEALLGDVALRVRTPLGLVARTLRYERDDRVLVAPSLAGVRRFRWLAVHQRLAAVGVRSTPRRGRGRTFASLRDYVVGDDPRHIDWKASARRGAADHARVHDRAVADRLPARRRRAVR